MLDRRALVPPHSASIKYTVPVIPFSIELTNDADYVLCPTSRYAHGESHIRALAAEHGFDIEACDAVTLRREHGRPVAGLVFVLKLRG